MQPGSFVYVRWRNPCSLARDASGASAVEFGMIAPILIILLFGICQVGWALHCASSVRYALDESARVLSINPQITATDVEAAMRERLEGFADPAISVTVSENLDSPGLRITNVRATYVYHLSVPMLPAWELPFQSVATIARPVV
jgi:Flp pilus assembly protein TadG